jgi:hypothetical protein
MLLLAAVTLLHLSLLLIPVVRQLAPEIAPPATVSVRLSPQAVVEPAPEPSPEPEPVEPPPLKPSEPIELAELPAPEPEPASPPPVEKPRISAHRILTELREKQSADPLAGFIPAEQDEEADYYLRYRPVLEDVLNEPSLQLPFRDTRIYLVNSYAPGFPGDLQRFFDDVTVPFGFTTKNNTRVQCAWILVIAGCSWGDVSHYYAKDKAKRRR